MALSFQIRSSALPSSTTVVAFRGSEGISRPYVFDVYVNVVGDDEVDLDDGPGARVSLTIDDVGMQPVVFEGMVATVELLRANTHNSLYLIRLVPNLWQLSLTKHSRIFTKMSVPDVIKAILDDEGIDNFEIKLTKSYEPEEQITQYKESSLNFIHRWMEREGLYYFFEQGDNGEKVVITDNKSTQTVSRVLPIPYHPSDAGDATSGPHFHYFTARHVSLPATVRFTDYDYNKPQLDVVGSSAVSKSGVGEQITYGNRFFTPDKGNALANVRAEDLRSQAKTFHAQGPVTGVSSGYLFSVENHPKLQLNNAYLAISVEHFGHNAVAIGAWGKTIPLEFTDAYHVEVQAIEASQQYRHPELATWPRLDGYENAIVDGPATSDYAQIDEHGRYALKFKFDEGTLKDGKASTFVRKMQPHAGTVEGWHFPERKGTEVICAFMGGDPDRPIVIGAIPTATTPSPVTAANYTQNVIQTGGRNRLELEDLAGQQRVTLSTPHSATHLLMGNPYEGHELIAKTQGNALYHTDVTTDHRIGVNWTVKVGADHMEDIGATLTQTVQSSVSQTWNDTHTLKVVGDVVHQYLADHLHEIAGDVTKLIGGAHTEKIAADDQEQVGGSKKREVSGDHEESCGGERKISVGGSFLKFVSGDLFNKIEGAQNETVAGAVQNVYLGLKSEFIGGAHMLEIAGIEAVIVGGAKFDAVFGSSTEISPDKNEFTSVGLKVHATVDEMKGVHTELKEIHEEISGMKSTETGMHEIASGMHEISVGLHSVAAALHDVDAAVIILA